MVPGFDLLDYEEFPPLPEVGGEVFGVERGATVRENGKGAHVGMRGKTDGERIELDSMGFPVVYFSPGKVVRTGKGRAMIRSGKRKP